MRKAILIAALLLCAFFLGAQAIDLSLADVSMIKWDTAQFSLAGPDKLYVRGVGYQGMDETFSMVLTMSMDADGQLHLAFSAPSFAGELDDGEVAYATAAVDGDALKLSPIIMEDGKAYAAWFALESAAGAKLVDYKEIADPVWNGSVQNLLLARVQLKNLVNSLQTQATAVAAATAAEKKAAADKAKADVDAAKAGATTAQADAEAAKKATAAAKAEADQAKKDAAVAKTTSDQLRVELNLLKSQSAGNAAIPVVDASKLDFSMARASIAGPNAIYLRNIYYAGEPVSLLLDISADGTVIAKGPYFSEQKLIQDSDEVAYVGVTPSGAYSVELSPVILGNEAYSGILEWTPGTNQFSIVSYKSVAMPEQYADLAAAVAKAKADAAKAKADADTLKTQVADLQKKLDAASKVVAAPAAATAAPAAAAAAPAYEKPSAIYVSSAASDAPAFLQKTVKDGKAPDTALPLYGSWGLGTGALAQSDSSLKFAKFPVTLPQNQGEILYSFTAKAKVGDWTGYGLHFLGTGSTVSNAYGFGNSYLVWITHDVNYYKNKTTYVQFYRSYDDATMIQLASVNIPESMGDALTTEVIYNPAAKTVNISVNGVSRLVYAVDSALAKGDLVAFRTLGGPVEFTDFAIKTK